MSRPSPSRARTCAKPCCRSPPNNTADRPGAAGQVRWNVFREGSNHPMNTAVDRLRLVDIGKSFGPVRALDGVEMAVKRGTVHGLLGENGAGKSTLLRILSGVLNPSSGHVEIDGQRLTGHGPVAARRAGIAMIHQELQHVPHPPAAKNFSPAHPRRAGGALPGARSARGGAAARPRAPLAPPIAPAAPIRTLKVAQRQIVEIARAMME